MFKTPGFILSGAMTLLIVVGALLEGDLMGLAIGSVFILLTLAVLLVMDKYREKKKKNG